MAVSEPNGPRVPMLGEEEARVIGKEVGVPSTMSGLNVFRIMSRHPTLAGVVAKQLAMLLYRGNMLDDRLRELIIMRIGWRTGAMYEWTQHWPVALRVGLTKEETLAVRDPDKACAEYLSTNEERLELVAAICNWNTFSILLKSLKIPLEEGIEAWPPDGMPSPAAD